MHDPASQWEIEQNPETIPRMERGPYQAGPMAILRFHFRNLLVCAGCFLGGLLLAGVFYSGATRIYKATGTFLVDEIPFVQTIKQSDSETERQLVQSLILSIANREMKMTVERKLELPPGRIAFAGLDRPLKFTGSKPVANVQVSLVKNSRLGMISVDSQSPDFAAKVVNAILDELALYNLIGGDIKSIQFSAALTKLEEEGMLQQLADVKSKQIRLEEELAEIKNYRKQNLSLASYPAFSKDATLNNLKTQLIIVESEYKYLTRTSTRGQRLIGKREEVKSLRAQMDHQIANLTEALEAEYEINSKQERALHENKLKAVEREDALSQASTRLAQSFGDPSLMRKLAEENSKKEKESGSANMLVVVNWSTPPLRPFRPQLALYLLLGGALGGLVGLALATFFGIFDAGLKSVWQIETQVGLPCLAILPKQTELGSRLRNKSLDLSDISPDLGFLWSLLLSFLDKEKISVVGFSPASPKQRSTELVADLATLFALGGKRVLVVDLHFGDPLLAKTLEVKLTGCMEKWVHSDDPISKHLSFSELRNLAVFSVCESNKKLEDAVARRFLSSLWKSLSSEWDFVLIDAPCTLTNWSLSLALPEKSPLILTADFEQTRMNILSQVCYHARGQHWQLEGVVMMNAPRGMVA